MNCGNCGSPLEDGNNICSNCGAINNIPTSDDEIVELLDDDEITVNGETETDIEEKENITENMAPPELAVSEENLTEGIKDIGSTDEVSDYEVIEEEKHEEVSEIKKDNVDISIPSVSKPVEKIEMPLDGSAPEIKENLNTVGITDQDSIDNADSKQVKKSKIKIKLGSKNVPKKLMIIVAGLFLLIGLLLGKSLFSQNYCITNTGNALTNDTKFVADGKNNVTNVGSFTYKIPKDYIFDKKDKGLLIYNKEDTFRIFIRADLGSYQDLSGAKNSIKETLRSNDVTVENLKEVDEDGKNVIVVEGITRNINRMIAFTDATNDYVFYIEIVKSDNSYDNGALSIAVDICKNAKYEEKTTNMEKIDIYDISEVAIKSSLEYKNIKANN